MRRLLIAIAVATLAACDCSGGPPKGVCNGTWNGVSYADAGLDETSRFALQRTQICTLPDVKFYSLSWGGGALTTEFSFRSGGPTSLSPASYPLPPSSALETWSLSPTIPDGGSGTLRLTILGISGRRGGTLELSAGAEQLSCAFDVPYDTEGQKVCASSGGGGDGD